MQRFSSILVAVDGSDCTPHLLMESIRLAQWSKGTVTAISVVPPYEGDLRLVGVKDIKSVLREPCERILGEVVGIAESYGASIKAFCREGVPHEVIVDFAENLNCDLIVAGAGRLGSFRRLLSGSVTAKVAARSKKDILVIPNHAPMGWEKILAVIDGAEDPEWIAQRAFELAESYGGEVILVPSGGAQLRPSSIALSPAQDSVDSVERVWPRGEVLETTHRDSVRPGLAQRIISDVARENRVDIIVMNSRKRQGFRGLLAGSVSERVIRSSACPVLLLGCQTAK